MSATLSAQQGTYATDFENYFFQYSKGESTCLENGAGDATAPLSLHRQGWLLNLKSMDTVLCLSESCTEILTTMNPVCRNRIRNSTEEFGQPVRFHLLWGEVTE